MKQPKSETLDKEEARFLSRVMTMGAGRAIA